jgi:hypothetical protein
LISLFKEGQITTNTLVIEENGSRWLEFQEAFPHLIKKRTQKIPQQETPSSLFTLSKTGPIRVLPLPVKKQTSNAVVLHDYTKLPDGSERKVLILGKDILPSTPMEALQQYVQAQEIRIGEIQKLLEREKSKLNQAIELLNQKSKQDSS